MAALEQGVKSHLAGDLATAAKCYASVLKANPACADAWHLSGVVAHQNGRSHDGLKHIARAIELNPSDAEYHSNLSTIYRALSQPEAALVAVDAAVHLDQHLAAAWNQRGSVLLDLERIDDAIDSFLRALELGYSAAIVWQNIGLAFQYSGNIASSIKHLEKAVATAPEQSLAYFHLANLVASGNYTFNEPQRRSMHEILKAKKTSRQALAHVHYAMARDLETRRDYALAFQHFRKANQYYSEFLTQEKRFDNDHNSFGHAIDDQINLFKDQSCLSQRESTLPGPVPIFIVGMPRSGTTLLAQMLAKHTDISSAGELTTIPTLIQQRLQRCQNRSAKNMLDSEWLHFAAESYLSALISASPETAFVIDKMPENFKYLGFIASLFPHARIIHCRRDPRDVCVSAYCQLFNSKQLQLDTSDLFLLGQNYRHYLRLMRHWRGVLPTQIYEVTYEKLVDDAEGELRGLLDYLRLPWSEDCLNFHEQTSNVRTASSLQVRRPLNRRSLGRWQRYSGELSELIDALDDAIDT